MSELIACVFCGSANTTTHEEKAGIEIAEDGQITEIPYLAWVHGCIDCGQQWTDHVDEDRRTAVLVAHNRQG